MKKKQPVRSQSRQFGDQWRGQEEPLSCALASQPGSIQNLALDWEADKMPGSHLLTFTNAGRVYLWIFF